MHPIRLAVITLGIFLALIDSPKASACSDPPCGLEGHKRQWYEIDHPNSLTDEQTLVDSFYGADCRSRAQIYDKLRELEYPGISARFLLNRERPACTAPKGPPETAPGRGDEPKADESTGKDKGGTAI